MGEPGGADGFSAVAAVDPGAKPEAQLDGEPQEVSEAPAYRVDDLTFLYLTHEVYLEPYVSCRPKVLGERSYGRAGKAGAEARAVTRAFLEVVCDWSVTT